MKKQNKQKGFTLVELVIVIAVIAILAGVLIPTFSGIVEKANKSAVQQEAASLYQEALALDLADGEQNAKDKDTSITKVEGKAVVYSVDENGKVSFSYTDSKKKYTATFDGNDWKVEEYKDSSSTSSEGQAQSE